MDLTMRRAGPDDAPFLAEMLAEAMAWRPGAPRPLTPAVLRSRYVVGWPRVGDCGVVAEIRPPDEGAKGRTAVRAGELLDVFVIRIKIFLVQVWRDLSSRQRLLRRREVLIGQADVGCRILALP